MIEFIDFIIREQLRSDRHLTVVSRALTTPFSASAPKRTDLSHGWRRSLLKNCLSDQ